jgi:hypothetical protein
MSGHDRIHTEPDAPVQEVNGGYQLYWEDVNPCRYYLAVNGTGAMRIEPRELNAQSRFRDWHLEHHLKPPPTEKNSHKYEEFIGRLFDAAIKMEEPLPFLQTDAGHVEILTQVFDTRISAGYRTWGQEYLDGGGEEDVRMKMDEGRIYFKVQFLIRFCRGALNMKEKDIDALKEFISAKGGYQGEKGAREWFRWTYWVPLKLFEGPATVRWFGDEWNRKGGESE